MFEIEVSCQLCALPLKQQILLGKVRTIHLLKERLRVKLLKCELINLPLHLIHFGNKCLYLKVFLLHKSLEQVVLAIFALGAIENLANCIVFLFYYLLKYANLLVSVGSLILLVD